MLSIECLVNVLVALVLLLQVPRGKYVGNRRRAVVRNAQPQAFALGTCFRTVTLTPCTFGLDHPQQTAN